MILGPIGQKWVCAAGVERSTLHRCGLTGLGLINQPFLSFINRALVGHFSGPGSISGSHKIKKRILFLLIKNYSLSFNRLFFFVNATKDLTYRFAYLTYER